MAVATARLIPAIYSLIISTSKFPFLWPHYFLIPSESNCNFVFSAVNVSVPSCL